ncbi:uncharacterized protein TNCV_1368561 [Trichonephila clavipes]|nr:uncharacterized protein TNCV_1368561 [Trichonephila clavipes]
MAAGRIFDPLGFASPFTIRFKILFKKYGREKRTGTKSCCLILERSLNNGVRKRLSYVNFRFLDMPCNLQKPCGSSKGINPSTFGANGSVACCEVPATDGKSFRRQPSEREIRSLTDKDSWRHCPGKDNPSDLLTRGMSADSLINCEKWWKGLSFLQEGNTVPVSNNVLLSDESAYLEELKPTERKTLTVILDNNLLNHILSVSNNFQKNLCIFSYIYRFINNCKRPSNKQIGPLRMCEIQRAEITLVKLVQQMEFNSEIKDLSCKGMVNPQTPNHGGLCEAVVKAVKYHLRRVMGNLRFTYEEFLTILNQIEGVLNSRPLYPLSCDPGDFDALTPGYFLVGRPITAIAEPSLTEVSDNRLKVWQNKHSIILLCVGVEWSINTCN